MPGKPAIVEMIYYLSGYVTKNCKAPEKNNSVSILFYDMHECIGRLDISTVRRWNSIDILTHRYIEQPYCGRTMANLHWVFQNANGNSKEIFEAMKNSYTNIYRPEDSHG
jgi:hypothetical protein